MTQEACEVWGFDIDHGDIRTRQIADFPQRLQPGKRYVRQLTLTREVEPTADPTVTMQAYPLDTLAAYDHLRDSIVFGGRQCYRGTASLTKSGSDF